MRIQETNKIMKEAQIARADHERHAHSQNQGFFSRARNMVMNTFKQMRSRFS